MAVETKHVGKPMRVFIQSCKTKLFFNGKQSWTKNLEEALSFASGSGAMHTAEKFSLTDVALLYAFGDPKYSFVSHLSKSCWENQVSAELSPTAPLTPF